MRRKKLKFKLQVKGRCSKCKAMKILETKAGELYCPDCDTLINSCKDWEFWND